MNVLYTMKYLAASSLLLGSAFFISTKPGTNKEAAAYKLEEAREEREGVVGYLKYLHAVKANQVSGEVDLEDVYAAREAADAMANNSALNKTQDFENLEFSERGANNVGGRCKAVLVDRNNSNKIYAASAGGGLWISNNKGNSWTKFTGNDSLKCLSINTIAQASNGDLYLGTGEGVSTIGYGITLFSAILIPGEGVFKSTDGGNSFTQLSATKPINSNSTTDGWAFVNKIACHPSDPQIVYAATSSGMKKSVDGGATWNNLTSATGKMVDCEVGAGDEVWFATTKKLYKSTNAGQTATAMPFQATGNRVEFAVAPSDPNTLVCVTITGAGGLHLITKTKDGGNTWDTLAKGGPTYTFEPFGFYDQGAGSFYGQGEWDIALGIHPTNPDLFYVGGELLLYRYNPGNQSFQTVAEWTNNPSNGDYVHADMHGVDFDPVDPEIMYIACDGGIYRTLNSTAPQPFFQERNKDLCATQPYGFAVNQFDKVVYGLQDNGSWIIGNEKNSPKAGLKVGGGDGGTAMMSDIYPNVVFSSVVSGNIVRNIDGGLSGTPWGTVWDVNIDADENEAIDGGAAWVTPCKIVENKNGTFSKSITIIGGATGVFVSQDASNPSAAQPRWFKLMNIGTSTAVEISPDGQVVYAAAANGSVYRISGLDLFNTEYEYTNGTSGPWNNGSVVVSTIGTFNSRYVTSLNAARSTQFPNQLIVTLGNYGNSSYVYKSTDAKTAAVPTFTDITSNLPKMPVFSAQSRITNDGKIILGTELGIWGSENGGSTWVELNKLNPNNPATWHPRVPTVQVITKNQYGASGEIIHTCTHGRGVFTSYSLATVWPLSTGNLSASGASIKVYPNPAVNFASVELNAKSASKGVLQLLDINGRVLINNAVQLQSGKNTFDINMANFGKGNYIVKITTPEISASTSIVK